MLQYSKGTVQVSANDIVVFATRIENIQAIHRVESGTNVFVANVPVFLSLSLDEHVALCAMYTDELGRCKIGF